MPDQELLERLKNPLDDEARAALKDCMGLCKAAEDLITRANRTRLKDDSRLKALQDDIAALKELDSQFGSKR